MSSNVKDKIVAYQLKDVAQTSYIQWKDNRSFRAGTISWEVFRRSFLIGSSQGRKYRQN